MALADCKVVRDGGYADALRAYRIFVNDEPVGTIARNATLEVEAPSGPLKVEARVDWGRSEPLLLQAAPNQTIDVEVRNHWGSWFSLWAITFGSKRYLTLKQIDRH